MEPTTTPKGPLPFRPGLYGFHLGWTQGGALISAGWAVENQIPASVAQANECTSAKAVKLLSNVAVYRSSARSSIYSGMYCTVHTEAQGEVELPQTGADTKPSRAVNPKPHIVLTSRISKASVSCGQQYALYPHRRVLTYFEHHKLRSPDITHFQVPQFHWFSVSFAAASVQHF